MQPRAELESSCPNGYDRVVVPQTLEQLQALPRIAAGLAANPAPYTAQELFDLGNLIDENDDGIFCLKDVSNLRGASVDQWGFFYWGPGQRLGRQLRKT